MNIGDMLGKATGFVKQHPYLTTAMGVSPLVGTQGGRNFLSSIFMGTPGGVKTTPTQTPQGMELLNQLMAQGMKNTNFDDIENMYMNKFYSDIIPGISDRWASQGDERNSSGFQSALGRAGTDLASRLAAMRSQYGLQQSQLGLQPQFESYYSKGQPGLTGVLGQLLPLLVKAGIGAL